MVSFCHTCLPTEQMLVFSMIILVWGHIFMLPGMEAPHCEVPGRRVPYSSRCSITETSEEVRARIWRNAAALKVIVVLIRAIPWTILAVLAVKRLPSQIES